LKRSETIETVVDALKGNELIISANGMISRELHATKDSPNNFYMLGSMGLASSIGLGLALSHPNKTIVILDGDGNILMNLGSLATIGNQAPKNLIHIVLDNECHDSTGGQPTVSNTTKLEKTAEAAGYKQVKKAEDRITLKKSVAQLLYSAGPSLILVKTERGGEVPPRVAYEPETITRRFATQI
jgi:thiamine pyrophosphate-dependent acetolactate synthase large subunit-like protein